MQHFHVRPNELQELEACLYMYRFPSTHVDLAVGRLGAGWLSVIRILQLGKVDGADAR